ncbi:MAG: DNA-deoxyinosine glycosylase [Gammaproteobacteria bacterium]
MSRVSGFPPITGPEPRVLILGSMPGVASLEQTQYYAHPRNAYWRIMGELFDAGPELKYGDRLDVLVARGIALWDVLESCDRPGSLDSNIRGATARPNDFAALFADRPSIGHVFFNGKTAAAMFRRKVLPELPDGDESEQRAYATLPSTSPAMAALSFEQKLEQWSAVRAVLEPDS